MRLTVEDKFTLLAILEIVSRVTGVEASSIKRGSREGPVIMARHVYRYIAKNTGVPVTTIGLYTGYAHGSIISGVKVISHIVEVSSEPYASIVKDVEKDILAHDGITINKKQVILEMLSTCKYNPNIKDYIDTLIVKLEKYKLNIK